MQQQFDWDQGEPESQKMDSAKLQELVTSLAARNTDTLLVARNDSIVCEWYAEGHGPEKPHNTASLAKAMVTGMSLAVAMDDGLISPDDPAHQYIPAWKSDPLKSKITIRHLATHTSGIENAEGDGPQNELPGWKGEFWQPQDIDPFTISRDLAPVIFEPGSRYAYSNTGIAMLNWAVTAALAGSEHKDIRTLLAERIMKPIGIKPDQWWVGYGKTYEVDGLPLVAGWGGAEFTPRAAARVGRLLLRRGDWQGRQLISGKIVDQVRAYSKCPLPIDDRQAGDPFPGSGLSWWVNFDGVWPSVPADAFAGVGVQHQLLIVIPSLDMIIVRNGSGHIDGESFSFSGVVEHLLKPLMQAMTSTPYPGPSPVVAKLNWAPPETIVRKCSTPGGDGSDNWPITWGDDDKLYTAYGDGFGFDYTDGDGKLSTGFSAVSGRADDFTGVDIDSPDEQLVCRPGDPVEHHGPRGKKICGMLMVGGVIYAWTRNANENGKMCQLLCSHDRGVNWQWANWMFEEFGYCSFVNYGPNYQGARDGYVYIVTPDTPSAYVSSDSFVLLRVPAGRITERDAYEFFVRLDSTGDPLWTADIAQRGSVFQHRRCCGRSGITYNPALGRYFWWQGQSVRGNDYRWWTGGFGVYDAPEPWGPWTTVYHTEAWDVPQGESGSFPTKWISQDGLEMHLVFSGEDRFSVRKASLELRS